MKALAVILLAAGSITISVSAQSNPDVPTEPDSKPAQPSHADLLNTIPIPDPAELDAMIQFQATTVSRMLGVQVKPTGVLPRALRTDNFLQLINPFAPARYGYGQDVTSINPRTGRAEGIVFVGFKF